MGEADTSPDATRVPRRFWWLKRILIALILLELSALGMRYLSLAVARRRLERELAALHARGEPILPVDFADVPVADDENAARDLLAACKAFHVPREHEKAWELLSRSPPWTAAELATTDAVLARNQQALAAVRQARGKAVANWGLEFKAPMLSIMLPMVNDLREVAQVLYFAARRAAAEGRHAEAAEYLRDLLTVSRGIESQPFLVSQLVASACSDMASNTAIAIAPGMTGDARVQMRTLIDDLLEEREKPRSGWKWAFEGERMMQLDLVMCLAGGIEFARLPTPYAGEGMMAWWMRPMILADAPELLRTAGMDVEAAAAPDAATSSAKLAPYPKGPIRKWWDVRVMRPPTFSRALSRHYQSMYLRRQAAITLAQRLYELEHGRKPAHIEELTPRYLRSVPQDPMYGGTMSLTATTQPAAK